MPNQLHQYLTSEPPIFEAAISLTLTNTLTHLGDPTWDIDATITIYDDPPTSQPQIQVSLTHE